MRKTLKSQDDLNTEIKKTELGKERLYEARINASIDSLLTRKAAKINKDELEFIEELKRELQDTQLLLKDKRTGEKRNWYQELKQQQIAIMSGPQDQKSLFGGFGVIGRYIVWGAKLLRYRFNQVEDIRCTYPKVDLFVPSMIDFDRWLYPGTGKNSRVTIPRQVEIMDLIGRLNKGTVHPFVAFDPRRYVEEGKETLEVVKTAIEVKGAIGVKLYPPMGYSPSGNVPSNECNLSQQETEKINKALFTLYAWCEKNDVPIMAHTADSNYNRICKTVPHQDQKWPDPKYWNAVLDKHPKLRLNLGHFATQNPFLNEWNMTIRKLMLQYPNVYADLSHVEELSDPNYANHFFSELKQFFEYDNNKKHAELLKQRIMYGSDWIMLAKERISDRYFDFLVSQYRSRIDNGQGYVGFAGKNALHYLGVLNGGNRNRLVNLYDNIWKIKRPEWFMGKHTARTC